MSTSADLCEAEEEPDSPHEAQHLPRGLLDGARARRARWRDGVEATLEEVVVGNQTNSHGFHDKKEERRGGFTHGSTGVVEGDGIEATTVEGLFHVPLRGLGSVPAGLQQVVL